MLVQRWLATRNINNFKAAASEFTLAQQTARYDDANIPKTGLLETPHVRDHQH